MASTPRHHVVPQFLLRRFADASGKLHMVSRDDIEGRRLPVTVNNACNEAGFYRVESEDVDLDHRQEHDPEVIEKHLSVFEDRGERALAEIFNTDPPWDLHARFHLVNFAALQYVRGWSFRRYLNEIGTLTMRRVLMSDTDRLREMAVQLLRSDGRAITDSALASQIDEIVGPSGPHLVSSKPNAIQTGMEFAFGPLGEMLWVRALRVLHFEENSPLLTSDNPVVTWSPRPAERVEPLRLAAGIALPVSPTCALWFARRGHDGHSYSGVARAGQINFAVADSAEKWIFAHPDTNPLANLDIPVSRATWVDEKAEERRDDDGTYRELWGTVFDKFIYATVLPFPSGL